MTTDDERDLAQALFRTLYDAGVSFQSGDLIPRLTATVRAAGFRRQGPITDAQRHADDLLWYVDYCLGLPMYQNAISEFGQGAVETLRMVKRTLAEGLHPDAQAAAERARSAVPSPTEQESDRVTTQDEARARQMRRTLLHTHSMTNMAGRLMPEGECAACDHARKVWRQAEREGR